eukprot:3058959-Rhodomonas_salina.1
MPPLIPNRNDLALVFSFLLNFRDSCAVTGSRGDYPPMRMATSSNLRTLAEIQLWVYHAAFFSTTSSIIDSWRFQGTQS